MVQVMVLASIPAHLNITPVKRAGATVVPTFPLPPGQDTVKPAPEAAVKAALIAPASSVLLSHLAPHMVTSSTLPRRLRHRPRFRASGKTVQPSGAALLPA